MRKGVAGIVIASEALDCSPNARKCGEESKQTGVRGVTLRRIIPPVGIKTEEQLDVLQILISALCTIFPCVTYTQAVRQ